MFMDSVQPVTLNCPLCDKSYSFSRGSISTCSSCGHEVDKIDEEAPRIFPSRRMVVLSGFLLFGGIVCLFLYWVGPVVPGIGVALILSALGMGHFLHVSCGHCCASLDKD